MTAATGTMTVIERISLVLDAIDNCEESGNGGWKAKHEGVLERIEQNLLPHGSGFDSGTTVEVERSNKGMIVFSTAFHHMDEHGGYSHWADYMVVVNPAFRGIEISVTSDSELSDELDLDFVGDVFEMSLNTEVGAEFEALLREEYKG